MSVAMASINREDYLTEQEVADFLGKKVVTIRKDRYVGKDHPPFLKFGARVLYPKREFQAWVSKQMITREARTEP